MHEKRELYFRLWRVGKIWVSKGGRYEMVLVIGNMWILEEGMSMVFLEINLETGLVDVSKLELGKVDYI